MTTELEMSNEFNRMMEKKGLKIGYATYMLDVFVSSNNFFEHLNNIINKKEYQGYYSGMLFSDYYSLEEDGDEYFGENKVLFFVGDGDDYETIEYDEFYEYLKATCEFYIKYHPDEKDKVNEKLLNIKKVYLLK